MSKSQSKNKNILIVFLGVLLVSIFCLTMNKVSNQSVDESGSVRIVVEKFGYALKDVFLLSPTASEDIEKNYKDFLDPVLLEEWKADSTKAVGRLTSSPWPDRIEVSDIKQLAPDTYNVSGKIIEMTSGEETQGGTAGSKSVEINVTKIEGRWLITKISVVDSSEVKNNEENELWKDYKGADGISFQYPEKLTTQYISTQEWPPVIKIQSGTYSCVETSPETSSGNEIITQKTINERIYCVNVKHEGAAGSVYSSYVYTTSWNDQLLEASFILHYVNCANYDQEQSQACASERETFNPDSIIDRVIQTVK